MNVCIDKIIFCIYNERESQNKSTCIGKCFCREIDSFGICEMRFAREMCLRHVKCLRACVDLFHFTFCSHGTVFHIWQQSDISMLF